MNWFAAVFSFVLLLDKNPINANPLSVESAVSTVSVETTSLSPVDVLQNQLNQILVQFCASEIDRNKTASAILKFGQLSNSKTSIKDVVQFYTKNYKDTFDNLLAFIDHISSLELQQIAYSTLIEAINFKQINVINLLSFESFIRNKLEDEPQITERTTYFNDLLSTIGNHIKESIVAIDPNQLIPLINNTSNSDRIFQLIPTIVQGINLTNFTDMNRIMEFSMQLPNAHRIKLLRKVLMEMCAKHQLLHVFHVICHIQLLRDSIGQNKREWTTTDVCSLSSLENEVPIKLKNLLQNDWSIKTKSDERPLQFRNLEQYEKYAKTLYVSLRPSLQHYWSFNIVTPNNSVTISYFNSDQYLSVEYCFHNDSFPTVRSRDISDVSQSSWYLLMSNDLNSIQIKNIYTNEFLILDDSESEENKRGGVTRVTLSSTCSDCDSGKWSLNEFPSSLTNFYKDYSCPIKASPTTRRPSFIGFPRGFPRV